MFKKLGIAALILVAGAFIVSKTTVGSYARTFIDQAKTKASKQVTLEFELERIRKDIDRILPDMKRNLGIVAQEIVAVETLQEDIAQMRTNLDKRKVALKEMKSALESGVTPVVFNRQSYHADSLRERLIRDLASCQRCEDALKQKEQLLEAKEKAVAAAREQLATIGSQKRELEVKLAQMEAEVKTLRIAQSKSSIQMDDSRLARVKASMADLEKRLREETVETELHRNFDTQVEVGVEPKKKSNDELLRDVEAYLNGVPAKDGDRVAGNR